MKNHLLAIAVLGLFAGCRQAEAPKELKTEKSGLETEKDKISYSLGMDMGNRLKRNEVDVDLDVVIRGIRDAQAGRQTLITEPDAQAILTAYQKDLSARREEKRNQLTEKNLKEGMAFLAENKTKPGVVTLPSGLQYKVITDGSGVTPDIHDSVVVNYRGTLLDGTEFDSSFKRGQPTTFPVGAVIPGWQEALPLMKAGSKWQLYVPSELAYREVGHPAISRIGPYATLVYELELLEVRSSGGVPRTPPVVTRGILKLPSMDDLKQGAKIEGIETEESRQATEKEKTP